MNAPGTISRSLFPFFLGYVLFREKLENHNPFKWSKTDRALFLIALFYSFGGLLLLLPIDHFFLSAPRHQTAGMWRCSFHSIMSVGDYWILLWPVERR